MKFRLLRKHSHLLVMLVLVVAVGLVLPGASWAANTPARPVPQTIWNGHDLRPIDPNPLPKNRDTTFYDEFTMDPRELDFFISLDIENGFLFMGLAHGLQVWDAEDLAANPSSTDHIAQIRWPSWPEWCGQFEKQFILTDVAVPAGHDDVAIMGGSCDVGVTIIDTRGLDKSKNSNQLKIAYQDAGFNSTDVYAAEVGGRRLGFAATDFGVRVYDLDAALKLEGCLTHNGEGSCPNVYLGEVLQGSITALTGTEDLVLVTRNLDGLGVYDFSNPTKPALLVDIPLSEFNRPAAATGALWRAGTSYYAAAGFTEGRSKKAVIYDVSCLTSPANCNAKLLPWELTLGLGDPKMSFSRSGGTPFVYIVSDSRNGGVQNEWLLDVSSPSAPRDFTPPPGTLDGETVGYWGWYYEGNPTGFRWALPRFGEFFGAHFFRAAFSIYDIHRLTQDQPPVADFDWASREPDGLIYGGAAGVGSLVDFIDASQGKVTLRTWTFDQGSPTNVTQQIGELDPTVRFEIPGLHEVTLTASNDVGSHTARQNVEVLDPAPFLSGVSSNVTEAPVCGTVRFAAEDLTGKHPLTFSWKILDDAGSEITPAPASPDDDVFEWTSDPGLTPGFYKAELTVSNSFGAPATKQSSLVEIQNLGNLSVQTPVLESLLSGTAQFSVASVGSTKWTWNFGDGSPLVVTTDPSEGARQTHQYTEVGTYDVTVKVENCRDGTLTSDALTVVVDEVQPLVANFRANLFCSGGVCQGEAGVPIFFQDFSQGAEVYEYDWDGNGTIDETSTSGPVTSHTYPSSGEFHPILTVSRGDGAESDTFTDHPRIILGAVTLPQIVISGPTSGETNQARTFVATCDGAGSTGWTWSVLGGQISGSATSDSVTVTWPTAGLKTLRASHSGCEAGSHSIRITDPDDGVVNPPPTGGLPTATFTAPAAGSVGQTLTFNASASTGQITTYLWDFGDGTDTTTGSPVTTHAYSTAGTFTVLLSVIAPPDSCTEHRGCVDEFSRQVVITGSSNPPPPPPEPEPVEPLTVCPDDPEAVCLLGDRFKVKVSFDRDGNTGIARPLENNPLPEQDTTGFLWFFEPKSVDLIVKMIRAQDYFWLFYGGLSDAEYTITVIDQETSTTRTYHNDFGNICGSADTQAFPIVTSTGDGQEVVLTGGAFGPSGSVGSVSGSTHNIPGGEDPGEGDDTGGDDTGGDDSGGDPSAGNCQPGQDTLCLLDGMYEVTVDWNNFRVPDDRGTGRAIQGTTQSGYFWFFDAANVELVVKIIDATSINGHTWVFYGGLSDVEYDLTVRNTETGAEKTFHNDGGNICGRADTEAF